MQIYWTDREKNKPPPEAIFSFRPFFSERPIFFQGPCKQIKKLPPHSPPLRIQSRVNLPNREQWIRNVNYILSQKIEKTVLARCQVIKLDRFPDPFSITAALEKKSLGSFLFCVKKGEKAFLGASPERLFSRQGTQLLTEALAGTRRRGATQEEDEKLQNELLSNPKDAREISPVQKFLTNKLAPLCDIPPVFSPIRIHQTQNVQHLYSQGTAVLKQTISDETVLDAIHPTPALCGSPQNQALNLIKKLEPFQRGLYGGVVGWMTQERSDWTVAIRCCFIDGKTVYLFSGAGIVDGSNGADEWEELNCKLNLFNEIFID